MSEIDVDAVRKEMESSTDPKRLLELALKQAEFDPEGMRRDIKLLDPTCVDTTRAITLKLGSKEFKPLVAYPIYTADYIRGYKNPRLLIEFDEVTLLPYVQFEADEKVREDAPDAVELLRKFLPEDTVYGNREEWQARCEKERKEADSKLPEPIGTFDDYEIRVLRFTSPKEIQFLQRLFVFCWFYIEGAQAPDITDDTWEVYTVTRKDNGAFVAYTSVYSFFYYRNGAQFETENAEQRTVRKRIAHFLVLPPYQGHGVGKNLYLQLLKYFVADPHVHEIEVEEPSNGFEILRDRVHYSWLTADQYAKPLLQQYADEPAESLEELISHFKLDKVQIQRVAEMFIYMEAGQKETRTVKKLIKSRLWEYNYEDLRDMDPATQREQLHRVYENALHGHRVALHLEEPDEEEEEEEEESVPSNPAEILLAQLAQGLPPGLSALPPADKKRRLEE